MKNKEPKTFDEILEEVFSSDEYVVPDDFDFDSLSKEEQIKYRLRFAPMGWEDLEEPPCYDGGYLCSTIDYVRGAFRIVSRTPCNVIETLDHFICCSCFWGYLHANPRYLNMSSRQLLECLSYDDKFEWTETTSITNKEYDEYILWWVATLLVYFQWAYSIDFSDWRKYFSVQYVYDMFYPLHEASFQNACDRLYDLYTEKKKEMQS